MKKPVVKKATKKVTKKTVKKAVKKTVAKKVTVPKLNIKGLYRLNMKFNDQVFEVDTKNLEEAILSFKPVYVKTKILIKIIKKNGQACERILFGMNGKRLFTSKPYLNIFINKLTFK